MPKPTTVTRKKLPKSKTGSVNCPRESASGSFTEEFKDSAAGLAAAAEWTRATRQWVTDTFTDMCAHDENCPKTRIIIRVTSALNPETRNMSYTLTFRVICHGVN